MVSVTELNSFVKKFKYLWKSGIGAHLNIDTHAGEAWVGLRVRLGHAPGPPHHQVHPQTREKSRNGPSRQRRRDRRAQERIHVQEAEEASKVESENVDAENAAVSKEGEKEPGVSNSTAEVVEDNLSDKSSNAEAYSCNLCDARFSSLRAIQTHEGKKHKVTGSPIPQVDGASDEEVVYTFISDFHKEDIEYTLQELFSENIEKMFESGVRMGGLQSEDQLCTLLIKIPPEQNFRWPRMSKSQSAVIKDLKTVPIFEPA